MPFSLLHKGYKLNCRGSDPEKVDKAGTVDVY